MEVCLNYNIGLNKSKMSDALSAIAEKSFDYICE